MPESNVCCYGTLQAMTTNKLVYHLNGISSNLTSEITSQTHTQNKLGVITLQSNEECFSV